MNFPVEIVFRSISRCVNVTACLNGNAAPHPCRTIVQSQAPNYGDGTYAGFQVPEPWVGQVDVAPILFVSSNPSIGKDDHSCGSTSDNTIWESHHLAFGDGSRPYIIDGVWTTNAEGEKLKRVRYWSWIKKRAQELIPDRSVIPGVDYALSEIVHCKSEHEVGVPEAAQTCADLHFENLMSVAAARVVVVVGKIARQQIFGEVIPDGLVERQMGGKPRLLSSLSHPASFGGGKKFASRYSVDDVQRLIEALGNRPQVAK
jgi:hypothetical protein